MLLIIDGSSLLSTCYYGTLPKQILFEKDPEKQKEHYDKILHASDGTYTNGIYGFIKTLLSLINEQKPLYVMIAFDKSRDTFRRKIYADYKGQRGVTPDPLKQQFITLEKLLEDAGFAVEYSDDYEADDLAGTAADKFADLMPVRIYTRDQDYFQLVDDYRNVRLWLVMQKDKRDELVNNYLGLFIDSDFSYNKSVPNNCFEFTEATTEDYYGVKPSLVPDLKGITGDPSDNIPGVKGVSSAAAPLLKEYGSLEDIYKAIEECKNDKEEKEMGIFWKSGLGISRNPLKALKEHKDTAFMSKNLATIRKDCTLKNTVDDMAISNVNMTRFKELCLALDIKSLWE